MAKILNTPEQVKELVQDAVAQSNQQAEERKNILQKSIEELDKLNPNFGGFDGVGLLL